MELEISTFSSCLVKVQMEKGMGILAEETTNRETVSVIRRMYLTVLPMREAGKGRLC